MKLPISMMIVMTIVIVVLLVVVSFFITSSSGAMSRTELQGRFTGGCIAICSLDQKSDATFVRTAYGAYETWMDACMQLHGLPRGAHMQCLIQCACGSLPTPCELLQLAANDVAANCRLVCDLAITHDATKAIYKNCNCACA